MTAEITTPEPTPPSRAATGISFVPLFHAAWLFAAGVVLAHFTWLRPTFLLIALVLLVFLCCVATFRAPRIAWLPLAVLWCMLGAWCAEMQPQPAPAPAVAALSDGLLRTVEGVVVDAGPVREDTLDNVDEPASAERTRRIDLRVSSIEVVTDAEDEQTSMDGGVRLTVRWPEEPADRTSLPTFSCGQRVRAVARLLPPEVYRDPDVWSRTDYLLDQGITSTASVNAESIESLGQTPGLFLPCRIAALQHTLSARMTALPAAMRSLPRPLRLSGEDAIMLAAMTTGDRTYLTHALRVGFERTGSFHMLVVSGLHLAVVAGCLFWLMRRLHMPRVPATLVTLAASFGYALLTGFATPVQRSLWMVTLYMVGRLLYRVLYRERSALNTIGFAVLCLLAVSPRSLFDAGLQMTLLAVVSIAGIAAPLLQGTVHPYLLAARDLRTVAHDVKLPPRSAQFRVTLRMIAMRLQRAASFRIAWRISPLTVQCTLRVAEALVVCCVVELAMTLPMALYFHRITAFALPVNMLILPLLALLLPAALVTLLVLLVWPAAAFIPAILTAMLLHLGVGLVRLFGSLAVGDLRIPAPQGWQSAAFCALGATAIALALRANVSQVGWLRRAAWAALLLAAIASVVPRPVDHPRDALLVEAIDVGQGDSLLLITHDGKTMLVDAGGFGGGPRQSTQAFDIGEEVVAPALWARGIRHLDVVALSHAHSDHMGGLPAILRNFHPAELWVGNNPRVAAYNAVLDEAAQLGIRVRTLRAGEALALGDTGIPVLAPFRNYEPGAEPANNDSLVLHVAYGGTSVLLEGDAEAPIEEAMLTEPGLRSTLLKVGHHGSVTSTRPEFLARVAPEWAVISCGLHNRYGHPREEVLAELQAARVLTFSTDIGGAVCFLLNGKTTIAKPDCAWQQPP